MRDEIGLYSSFYFFAVRQSVADFVRQQGAEGPGGKAQCHTAQNVGGEVDVEVQPGEADERRQNQCGHPEPAVLEPQGKCRRKARRRVPGGGRTSRAAGPRG